MLLLPKQGMKIPSYIPVKQQELLVTITTGYKNTSNSLWFLHTFYNNNIGQQQQQSQHGYHILQCLRKQHSDIRCERQGVVSLLLKAIFEIYSENCSNSGDCQHCEDYKCPLHTALATLLGNGSLDEPIVDWFFHPLGKLFDVAIIWLEIDI